MTDQLPLPARRELPPDVRLRLRETVTAGLGARRRGRAVAAVAAVAVLVAGAVVGAQFLRSRPAGVAGAAADLTTTTLDRCWAGLRTSGKAGQAPDRSKWAAATVTAQGDDIVVAFTAERKPMFCETTATTVTMSDPNAEPRYAAGSHTALLLYTGTGLAAGVADPAWSRVYLSIKDGPGISLSDVRKDTKQFTSFTLTDPATTTLSAQRWDNGQTTSGWPRADLPKPPAPLFTLIDRPGDRSSRAGKALGACLGGLAQPPSDRDGYQPGVLLEDGPYQVVLGRTAAHTIACTTEPDPDHPSRRIHRLYRDTFIGASIPARRLSVPGLGPDSAKVAFVGIVPPSGASMIADFALGEPVDVPVSNGTFGTWLPAGAKPVGRDGSSWVKVSDDKQVPLFNGYISMK